MAELKEYINFEVFNNIHCTLFQKHLQHMSYKNINIQYNGLQIDFFFMLLTLKSGISAIWCQPLSQMKPTYITHKAASKAMRMK